MTADTATAEGFGDFLLNILKDRKPIIKFEGKRPLYNDLEIGDLINFSNWPSDLDIYGITLDTDDIFMITETNKLPDNQIIECIEVSNPAT